MNESGASSLSRREIRDRLRLIRSENVGPITYHRLVERFGGAREALDALPDLARRGGRAKPVRICPEDEADRELETLDRLGARLIALGEPDYPPLLSRIEDAPPLLSLVGNAGLLRKAAVAVVGARNASLNGRQLAKQFGADLGRGGLLVVSGMARGIDAAAHDGALPTGTVAVLGGGVDVVYPKENADLYRRIAEEGAIVSEDPPGVQPQARHFPKRNRLISGMSRGAVVVEANARSGSLITARFAVEQGREVFAVPGSPLDPRSKGPNGLIRQGATLVESANDVLEVLKDLFRAPLPEERPPLRERFAAGDEATSELDSVRRGILEILGPVAVAVDEVIRSGQFSPAAVNTVLLELEMANRVERHPGNRVSLLGRIDGTP